MGPKWLFFPATSEAPTLGYITVSSAQVASVYENPASYAIDGNTSTYWREVLRYSQYWTAVFSSPRIIKRLEIYCSGVIGGGFPPSNYSPKYFYIQGSNNNSDWTNLTSEVHLTWTTAAWQNVEFTDNTTAYQYYRILFTASQGSTAGLVEVKAYGVTN